MTNILIILSGPGIIKDTPTSFIRGRLDEAIKFYKQNPDFYVIVSGKGKQSITSSSIMKKYLVEVGQIPHYKIFEDPYATNTVENSRNSFDMIEQINKYNSLPVGYDNHGPVYGLVDNVNRVVVVTSAFHITRTKLIFDKVYSGYNVEYVATTLEHNIIDVIPHLENELRLIQTLIT